MALDKAVDSAQLNADLTPLTFQMHTRQQAQQRRQMWYATEYKMNNSDSNTGGWADCLLRTTGGFKTIKSKMPAEVVAALKAVTKKTTAGGASSAIDTTEDTLFLLSEIEVQGTRTHSYAGEGTQYAYYQTAANQEEKPRVVSALAEDQQHQLLLQNGMER